MLYRVCVCVHQERLESLVFGLLRQRKLDFLDIYNEEMIQAAKGIVTQVRSPSTNVPLHSVPPLLTPYAGTLSTTAQPFWACWVPQYHCSAPLGPSVPLLSPSESLSTTAQPLWVSKYHCSAPLGQSSSHHAGSQSHHVSARVSTHFTITPLIFSYY